MTLKMSENLNSTDAFLLFILNLTDFSPDNKKLLSQNVQAHCDFFLCGCSLANISLLESLSSIRQNVFSASLRIAQPVGFLSDQLLLELLLWELTALNSFASSLSTGVVPAAVLHVRRQTGSCD